MTRVTVLRESIDPTGETYRAVAGGIQSAGRTAGEAVAALAAQLPEGDAATLILVRDLRADDSYATDQRDRLKRLMAKWRAARDTGEMSSESSTCRSRR